MLGGGEESAGVWSKGFGRTGISLVRDGPVASVRRPVFPPRLMKTRAVALACLTFCLVFLSAISGAEAPSGVWAKIYSSDIPTYAANLRAAGVPEATVG